MKNAVYMIYVMMMVMIKVAECCATDRALAETSLTHCRSVKAKDR